MSREDRSLEIAMSDRCISMYFAQWQTHKGAAEHHMGMAEQAEAMMNHWISERDRFLGEAGITNVVSLETNDE